MFATVCFWAVQVRIFKNLHRCFKNQHKQYGAVFLCWKILKIHKKQEVLHNLLKVGRWSKSVVAVVWCFVSLCSNKMLRIYSNADLTALNWVFFIANIYVNKDGHRFSPSSHWTKIKPKYSRNEYCYLALVTSFNAKVCTALRQVLSIGQSIMMFHSLSCYWITITQPPKMSETLMSHLWRGSRVYGLYYSQSLGGDPAVLASILVGSHDIHLYNTVAIVIVMLV